MDRIELAKAIRFASFLTGQFKFRLISSAVHVSLCLREKFGCNRKAATQPL